MHYVNMDENAFAYRDRGPSPSAGDRAGAGGARQRGAGHLRSASDAARPGELVTAFVSTSEPIGKDALQALYRERYADEPFVTVRDRAPGLRDVRDTNQCHIYVTVEEHGRVLAFAAIDNLWKGAAVAGGPEPEPDARAAGGRGDLVSEPRPASGRCPGSSSEFFRSRWVAPPDGTEQSTPAELPPGFRAGAAACGLKGSGETDVGVLACDDDAVVSALLLTRNASAAAPIRVCRERCDGGLVRAVVVNSGNANAATGEQGIEDALRCRRAPPPSWASRPPGRCCRDRDDRGAAADLGCARRDPEACSTLSRVGGERSRRDHDDRPRAEAVHGALSAG